MLVFLPRYLYFLYSYDTKHLLIRLINVQNYDKLDRYFYRDVLCLNIEVKNIMAKKHISIKDESVVELRKKDSHLGKLIEIIGDLEIETRPDFFKSLVRSIIGQQVSVQSAEAVYHRLKKLTNNELTVEKLSLMTVEDFQGVGLSARKIKYIQDLIHHISRGELDLNELKNLDNQTVIKTLTNVKGIGKWTAEMFLIFSLGRMDVLAIDDIGLQRGAKWLYQVDKSERRSILIEKEPIWYPHLTIAACYLWEIVHLQYTTLYQSIDEITL